MNNITAETRIRRGPPSPRDRRVRGAPLTSLGAIPHFLGFLNLRLGSKARVAFRVVGILAGAYACSLSAMAAVEEEIGQEVSSYAYSETTLLSNITTPFFIDSINDQSTSKYLSTLSNYRGDNGYFDRTIQEYTGGDAAFSRSKNLNGFDELIPEAVWTLDGSAGAHLDHIRGGPGTEIYTAFGRRLEITDFWSSATFGSWGSNNTNDALHLLPLQFQVASCGGSAAEHSNLDYCNDVTLIAAHLDDTPQKLHQDNSNSAAQSANIDGLSSTAAPASNPSPPPNIAAVTPAPAAQYLLPGTLSLLGPCGDVSASCTIVLTDVPEMSVDTPLPISLPSPPEELIPPIDPLYSEAPPLVPLVVPLVYPSDTGPGLNTPPIFTSEPLDPIPEVSTWVMIIIGFSFMFFVCGKKRRPRIDPISIIDVSVI